MEFLDKLGIDVKIIAAQIINFLVLVFLLRLFLYKRLMKFFEKEADAKKELARGLEDLAQRRHESEAEASARIANAQKIAEEVLERTRNAATRFRDRQANLNEREIEHMIQEGRSRLQAAQKSLEGELAAVVRQKMLAAIRDFFSPEALSRIHDATVAEALRVLPKLLAERAAEGVTHVDIGSAHSLNQSHTSTIEKTVKKMYRGASFSFREDPSLIAGLKIKLDTGYVFDFTLLGKLTKE